MEVTKDKLTVFLDIGHGPNNSAPGKLDPGAVDSLTHATEYGIATEVALGAKAILDASEDKTFELVIVPDLSRSGVANHVNLHAKNKGRCVLISLHMNASKYSSSSGTEVIIASTGRKTLMAPAIQLGVTFSKGVNRMFRGVKADTQIPAGYVTVLRLAQIPAFLIEMGFIGNKSDLASVREHGARALIASIEAYNKLMEN